MTDTPATPNEIAVMRAKANEAIKRLTEELAPLGITASVAAILLSKNVPAAQRIAIHFDGSAEEIINLVGALAGSMMPEDYSKLFYEMCTNPLFLRLLEVNRVQQQDAAKPTMVN